MAVPISPGSLARRPRSPGCWARCHREAPIADQVVSIPAIINKIMVPRMCSLVSLLPPISASMRNEVRSSLGWAMWSSIWASM